MDQEMVEVKKGLWIDEAGRLVKNPAECGRPTRFTKARHWRRLGITAALRALGYTSNEIAQLVGVRKRAVYNLTYRSSLYEIALAKGWKGNGRAQEFQESYDKMIARSKEGPIKPLDTYAAIIGRE